MLANPFSRFAKYFLIETNLTTGGPWYSIYLYGEKPAVAYHLQQRAQPVNPANLIGPYSNSATAYNMSSLYAHSHVAFANTADTPTGWQKAIDDNPETATSIAPSKDQAGLVIRYDSTQSIQRISVLTDGKAKGKLEFFLSNQAATVKNLPSDIDNNDSQFIKASNEAGLSPAEMKPVATVKFDGSDARGSADFAPVSGSQLIARWTPDEAGQLLAVREVNSFGGGPAMSETRNWLRLMTPPKISALIRQRMQKTLKICFLSVKPLIRKQPSFLASFIRRQISRSGFSQK